MTTPILVRAARRQAKDNTRLALRMSWATRPRLQLLKSRSRAASFGRWPRASASEWQPSGPRYVVGRGPSELQQIRTKLPGTFTHGRVPTI